MYSLTRLLFRALRGRPIAQIIVGILLIPVGILISFAATSGTDGYIYPYWIIAGIVFAVVGVIFIVRGIMTLMKPKPSVQSAMGYGQPNSYMAPNQYGQQVPYGSPQYPPQGQGYAAPAAYPPQAQAYGQPQMPYGQPPAYGQAPYPQQPYEQVQYPQQ